MKKRKICCRKATKNAVPRVAWPAAAKTGRWLLREFAPGRIDSQPTYGGRSQSIDRGFAVWRGSMEVQASNDPDVIDEINAALAELGSRLDNWAEIPLGLRTIDRSANVTAVDAATGSIATLDADPGNFKRGKWFRINKRVFMIESANPGQLEMKWKPDAPIAAVSAMEPLATIRLRLDGPQDMAFHYGYGGPWPLNWQEHPYD